MWTANIIKKEFEVNQINITVEFGDGVQKFTEKIGMVSKTNFEDTIRKRLKDLETLNSVKEEVNVGQIIPPTPPEPTPEEIKKQKYLGKRAELVIAKQDLDMGIISEGDFNALQTEVISLKP